MKIAIISDIHGNLEALKTTLEDIQKRKIDKIFCLGDTIMKGHHSEECVKLVRENCDVVIRGNCDTVFDDVVTESIHNIPVEVLQQRIDYCKEVISEESKEYLRNLPFCYEFYMSGSLIRMFHAHPSDISGVIINEDSYEKKYEMIKPTENTVSNKVADIVIFGHLHAPFMNKMYNKTLINVGSVGNSFNVVRDDEKDSSVLETTNINYLILDGEFGAEEYGASFGFEFVRIPYNIDKELEDLDKNIEPDAYIGEVKEGRYRNMSKILEKAEEIEKNKPV